ncbi:MAG: hypothetical protein PHI63_05740 [Patescibacteria group bacterium]|nr:hypothetical protein [Patescibacteria group bacterium]
MAVRNFFDPKSVATLTAVDLGDDEVYRGLRAAADEFLQGADVGDAHEALKNLIKILKSSPTFRVEQPGQWEKYQALIVQLQWACVPILTDDEVENLFRKHLLFAFEREVDVEAKLGGFFRIHRDTETLGYRRLIVLRGLKENQEQIGREGIPIGGSGTDVAPTVQNWLRDYDQSTPRSRTRGVLAQEHYLSTGTKGKKLTPPQRDMVRRLVKLYDFLRYPQLPEEIVEPTGHEIPSRLISPQPDTGRGAAQSASPQARSEEIRSAFRGEAAVEATVQRELESLRRAVGNDPRRLRDAFYHVVRERNIATAVAVLRLLCERDELLAMLSGDEKLQQYLQAVWPALYGAAAAQRFAQSPLARQSVVLFIQYILQERLGLPEGEAARVGAQLGNILANKGHREYDKLAYYDVAEQTFKWLE